MRRSASSTVALSDLWLGWEVSGPSSELQMGGGGGGEEQARQVSEGAKRKLE
jgi:hypothetical protein